MGACLSGSSLPPPNPDAVDLTHFELLKVVGKGGFGKVNAITALATGELLALKRMEKAKVLKSKSHLSMVWTERLIMSLVESRFLCHLKFAFESDTELFLVMPFLQGGDLRFHLRERGRMSESTARFYAAEMILGLEELHSKNIVYRDLKPENVLLDEQGHLRVTDFGLACILKPEEGFRTRGQAGTRGYMAPETLALKGYGLSVDFFSFGVMLYELLHGSRPWKTIDPNIALEQMGEEVDPLAAAKTKRAYEARAAMKANNGNADDEDEKGDDGDANNGQELRFSSRLTEEATSLLSALLAFNPSLRLGCTSKDNGWAAVRAHPWFGRVDWDAMKRLELRPPFQPDVSQANCTPDADLADQLLDKKPKRISDEEQKAFVGWNWNTEIKNGAAVPAGASGDSQASDRQQQSADSTNANIDRASASTTPQTQRHALTLTQSIPVQASEQRSQQSPAARTRQANFDTNDSSIDTATDVPTSAMDGCGGSEAVDVIAPLITDQTQRIHPPLEPQSPASTVHSPPRDLHTRSSHSRSANNTHTDENLALPNAPTDAEPNSPAFPILSLPSSTRPSITGSGSTTHLVTHSSSHRKSVSVGNLSLMIHASHSSGSGANTEKRRGSIERRWTLGQQLAHSQISPHLTVTAAAAN